MPVVALLWEELDADDSRDEEEVAVDVEAPVPLEVDVRLAVDERPDVPPVCSLVVDRVEERPFEALASPDSPAPPSMSLVEADPEHATVSAAEPPTTSAPASSSRMVPFMDDLQLSRGTPFFAPRTPRSTGRGRTRQRY